MILSEDLTFYDILDVAPNATPQEVREAYLKTKGTFNRDSVALYTIITKEEREETLKKIEEAYFVLSNPERRRQYDKSYGFLADHEMLEEAIERARDEDNIVHLGDQQHHGGNQPIQKPQATIVSIDRVPPMETLQNSESLLVPPTTDFSYTRPSSKSRTITHVSSPSQDQSHSPHVPPPPPTQAHVSPAKAQKTSPNISINGPNAYPGFRETRSPMPALDSVLLQAIEMETEWRGIFLRKVREAYKISIEEMAGITKVTKTYLLAIEDEDYKRLPAAVYIRGFVTQLAKVLKLPHDKVANAYICRYTRNKE